MTFVRTMTCCLMGLAICWGTGCAKKSGEKTTAPGHTTKTEKSVNVAGGKTSPDSSGGKSVSGNTSKTHVGKSGRTNGQEQAAKSAAVAKTTDSKAPSKKQPVIIDPPIIKTLPKKGESGSGVNRRLRGPRFDDRR